MKKQDITIGLSAYNNSYWKGIFYPEELPASRRFEYYCKHFNSYEINATFYKFPTAKSLKAWHAKSPEDFTFAVKAPKIITHFKKFIDTQKEIDEFYAICKEGLGNKLGHLLFQLPPSFAYSQERLDLIMTSLNKDFNNVVEFRNTTWWMPEVFDAFKKHQITFCSVSYPKLPTDIIRTTSRVYIRLHGVPKLFYSGYSDSELQQLIHNVLKHEELKKAFVYFNNTAGAEGILNAIGLKALIK